MTVRKRKRKKRGMRKLRRHASGHTVMIVLLNNKKKINPLSKKHRQYRD